MTAQISDIYKRNNQEYKIVAMSEPMTFKPQDYGMNPEPCITSCWRGYWCEYEINEEGLFLKNLFMHNGDDDYPDINGVKVLPLTYHEADCYSMEKGWYKMMTEDYCGHRMYKDIDLRIPYTGRILLGDGFIREYYIHMGYQRAWAYKTLIEFIFENGLLVETIDHSDIAAKIREQMERHKQDPDYLASETIKQFISDSFSLKYKDKAWWIVKR